MHWRLPIFTEEQYTPGEELTGIILGHLVGRYNDGCVTILVIKEVKGVMERVALASIRGANCERFDVDGVMTGPTGSSKEIEPQELIREREEVRLS